MKAVSYTRETQTLFIDRINRIQPDTVPQWGSLTPPQTIKHFATAFQMSLGEIRCDDLSSFFSRNIVKYVLFYIRKSIPKNIKAPDCMTESPTASIEKEKSALTSIMDRFLDALEADPRRTVRHPILGMLSLQEWSVLHGIHLNHHLMQFNV